MVSSQDARDTPSKVLATSHARLPQTREEDAEKALSSTAISRKLAQALSLAFLVPLFMVPVLQVISDVRSGERPLVADILHLWRGSWQGRVGLRRVLAVLPPPVNLWNFQTRLEKDNILTALVAPTWQAWLTNVLGVGSQTVWVGTGGRLFFFKDVEYLTHGPFPVTAQVAEFKRVERALSEKGVDLIVLPVSPSTTLYWEHLSSRVRTLEPVENPAFDTFIAQLRRAGLRVFDPRSSLAAAKLESVDGAWMTSDSHWTPAGMARVAKDLAHYISSRGLAQDPFDPRPELTLQKVSVSFQGDLCALLHGRRSEGRCADLNLQIDQVRHSDGTPLAVDLKGDILIVGDSLSVVFDNGSSGRSGGLAQHLAFRLGHKVDRLIDFPSFSTAPMHHALSVLARSPERLCGKRLVVWEFNTRWLAGPLTPLPEIVLGTCPSLGEASK